MEHDRTPRVNRVALRLIRSPWGRLVDGHLTALRYVSAAGRTVVLPVQWERDAGGADLVSGQASQKRWWRHFRAPAAVEVWADGGWRAGTAHVVEHRPGDLVAIRISADLGPRAALDRRTFLRLWIALVTLTEALGFAVPAVVGAALADAAWPVVLAALLAAGAVEGTLLGAGQATVLRRLLPGLDPGRWTRLTALAAVVAYALGMAPSTWASPLFEEPSGAAWAAAGIGGVLLLASIGGAQWLELRLHLRRAWRWVVATAVAWLVALGAFLLIATPLWRPGQSLPVAVLVGVVAGVVMAAVQATVTGLAMDRMVARGGADGVR
ncbi:hypothetical protein [Nocardioides sp. YIM 152588]|uniref:hypothetical protein n=1 Tax=Nocardioides sp. YIM 152588 TaxID=3158259 RepID=UPI0032E3DCB4